MIRPGVYQETPVILRPVYMVGLSDAPEDRPILAGLSIRVVNHDGPLQDCEFRGFAVLAQVTIVSDYGGYSIIFVDCELRDGAVDQSKFGDTLNFTLARCVLAGSTAVRARLWAHVDTCEVSGRLNITGESAGVVVRGSTFVGNGTGYAIAVGAAGIYVSDNRIRGYRGGISVTGSEAAEVYDNIVEDCETGIYAAQIHVWVARNVVRRCQTGIDAYSYGGVSVLQNIVSDIVNEGVFARESGLDIRDNIVMRCGGNGMGFYGAGTVSGNTIAFSGRSGMIAYNYDQLGIYIRRNIAYRNALYGIQWWELRISAFETCNNWFENQAGAVFGRPLTSGDLSVDPLFCDPDSGDFHLDSASPLADWAGCGQIGALGVNCGPTATLVQRFAAGWAEDGVRVVWEVAEGGTASEIWLERSEAAEGAGWVRPATERSFENRAVVELDRSAELGREYWYRLVAREGGDDTVIGAPIMVEGQALLASRLVGVGPNPGSGPVRIGFTLMHAAQVEVDIFDVQGRLVASPGRGSWPAGAHELVWDGRARNGELAPAGMYVVQYAHPGGQDRRAIVRVR